MKKLVLMYHNISDDGGFYSVDPDVFEKQMSYIQGMDNVIVSFDDGYKGWVDYALPVLLKYGIKAIFFVATGFLDRDMEGAPGLSEEDVRLLKRSGMEIGSHGVTHKPLNTFETLEFEAVTSKATLSEIVGEDIRFFSLPKGALLKGLFKMDLSGLGYERIYTSVPGFWNGSSFFVPRVVVRKTDSMFAFKALVNGNSLLMGYRNAQYHSINFAKKLIFGEELYLKIKRFLWK